MITVTGCCGQSALGWACTAMAASNSRRRLQRQDGAARRREWAMTVFLRAMRCSAHCGAPLPSRSMSLCSDASRRARGEPRSDNRTHGPSHPTTPPPREPAPVRAAATVLLLRDTPPGHRSADDAPLGHRQLRARRLRLPGGHIDAADAQAHALATRRPHGQSRRAAHPGHRRHPRELRGTRRPAGAPCRRPPRQRRRHRGDGPQHRGTPSPTSAARAAAPARDRPGVHVLRTGSPTATCRAASTCPSWSRACPRARRPRPTRPSSSSRCGCGRPTRWRATRPAVLHDLPDRPHAGAHAEAYATSTRCCGLRPRRAAAVDQLPARRPAQGAKEARYMETTRRSASWRWSAPTARSCMRSTGRARSRCRC
jgi:hypothetical protein